MLGVISAEACFPVRLVKYQENKKEDGHAWLEVDAGTTLIVDPSNGNYVKPLWEVQKIVSEDQDSFESKWYARKGVEYLFP